MLFERESNLCLITQTITEYLERVPPANIYLMRGPIQTINSVQYYDTSDTLQTSSGYNSDIITGGMGRVWYPNGQPNVSSNVRPVMQVQFVAGFGDNPTAVPQPICQAISLLAAYWFEQRTPYSEQTIKDVPMGFSAILDAYKIGNIYDWNKTWNDRCPYGHMNPWAIDTFTGWWGY